MTGWWFQPLWIIWVNWGYDIPNIWKVIKFMFQTTNPPGKSPSCEDGFHSTDQFVTSVLCARCHEKPTVLAPLQMLKSNVCPMYAGKKPNDFTIFSIKLPSTCSSWPQNYHGKGACFLERKRAWSAWRLTVCHTAIKWWWTNWKLSSFWRMPFCRECDAAMPLFVQNYADYQF